MVYDGLSFAFLQTVEEQPEVMQSSLVWHSASGLGSVGVGSGVDTGSSCTSQAARRSIARRMIGVLMSVFWLLGLISFCFLKSNK